MSEKIQEILSAYQIYGGYIVRTSSIGYES